MDNRKYRFKSASGDWYDIPLQQAQEETNEYWMAFNAGDEQTMMHFEEGFTGWKFIENDKR